MPLRPRTEPSSLTYPSWRPSTRRAERGLRRIGVAVSLCAALTTVHCAGSTVQAPSPEIPPPADADHDGIGANDQCPDDAETMNGYQDDDGCPDRVAGVLMEPSSLVITQSVHFVTHSDAMRPESHALLDEVARTLQDNPHVTRVEIQGHTDPTEPDPSTTDLGLRRAEAVMSYLVTRGVDRSRLQPHNYAETCPLNTNSTAAGRARNRRVDFRIVATSDPAFVPLGQCVTQ